MHDIMLVSVFIKDARSATMLFEVTISVNNCGYNEIKDS